MFSKATPTDLETDSGRIQHQTSLNRIPKISFSSPQSSPDRDFCVKLLDHPSQFAVRMLLVFGTQISQCVL